MWSFHEISRLRTPQKFSIYKVNWTMFHTWTWQLFGSWKEDLACAVSKDEMMGRRNAQVFPVAHAAWIPEKFREENHGDTCFGYHTWKHGSLSLGIAWEMMIPFFSKFRVKRLGAQSTFGMFTFNSSRIFSPPIQLGEFLTFSMVLHFLLSLNIFKPKKIKSCRYFNHLLWKINNFHQ